MEDKKETLELDDKSLEEVNGGILLNKIEKLSVVRGAVACEDSFATDAVRAAVKACDMLLRKTILYISVKQ